MIAQSHHPGMIRFASRSSMPSALLATALALCGCGEPRAEVLDLEGRPTDPLVSMPAAVVLIFTRTDCPISNRYAPEVQRLHEKFTSRDVRFYLVYPNPDVTVPQIRKHLEDYSYTMTALRDPRHRLVDTVRATFTPEAVVFVPGALSGGRSEPRLVYKGRIDDRFVDFGKARPAATTRDLEQKLEAILSGEPVSLTTTPGIGCLIRDLK